MLYGIALHIEDIGEQVYRCLGFYEMNIAWCQFVKFLADGLERHIWRISLTMERSPPKCDFRRLNEYNLLDIGCAILIHKHH